MISLYSSLVNSRGLSSAVAWRTSFAVVPVPILLFVAFITLWYGTDCPAGAWSARHTLPASAIAARNGHFALLDEGERRVVESKMAEKTAAKSEVVAVDEDEEDELSGSSCHVLEVRVILIKGVEMNRRHNGSRYCRCRSTYFILCSTGHQEPEYLALWTRLYDDVRIRIGRRCESRQRLIRFS